MSRLLVLREYSHFRMSSNPANTGVSLVQRLEYGVVRQTGNVYANGSLLTNLSTQIAFDSSLVHE
jgi:hypothetical protein